MEVEVPIIYKPRDGMGSQTPLWLKDLVRMFPDVFRRAQQVRRQRKDRPNETASISAEGIQGGVPTQVADAARLGLRSDRIRPGHILTGMSSASGHINSTGTSHSGQSRQKDPRKLVWNPEAGLGQFERRSDLPSPTGSSKPKPVQKIDGNEPLIGRDAIPFLYQSLRSSDDVALNGDRQGG